MSSKMDRRVGGSSGDEKDSSKGKLVGIFVQ